MQAAKLRRVHDLAQQSVGLQAGCEALQLAVRLHLETWQALQQQLVAVDTGPGRHPTCPEYVGPQEPQSDPHVAQGSAGVTHGVVLGCDAIGPHG